MAGCEKCWRDAHRGEQFSVADEYQRILKERDAAGKACTPEEQAGPDATKCRRCDGMTVHQHAGVCMACGDDQKGEL